VALWSGKKFVVYNISQEKSFVRVAGRLYSYQTHKRQNWFQMQAEVEVVLLFINNSMDCIKSISQYRFPFSPGSFASESQIAALYELNVYTAEKNQILVRTCQVAKTTWSCSNCLVSFPTHLALCSQL